MHDCAHFPSDKDSRRTLEMAVGFFFFHVGDGALDKFPSDKKWLRILRREAPRRMPRNRVRSASGGTFLLARVSRLESLLFMRFRRSSLIFPIEQAGYLCLPQQVC